MVHNRVRLPIVAPRGRATPRRGRPRSREGRASPAITDAVNLNSSRNARLRNMAFSRFVSLTMVIFLRFVNFAKINVTAPAPTTGFAFAMLYARMSLQAVASSL